MSDVPEVSCWCSCCNRVLLSDGQELPITWFGFGKHDLPSSLGADRAVAGPDKDGHWYGFLIENEPGGNC